MSDDPHEIVIWNHSPIGFVRLPRWLLDVYRAASHEAHRRLIAADRIPVPPKELRAERRARAAMVRQAHHDLRTLEIALSIAVRMARGGRLHLTKEIGILTCETCGGRWTSTQPSPLDHPSTGCAMDGIGAAVTISVAS
jgi:hypothetical protein